MAKNHSQSSEQPAVTDLLEVTKKIDDVKTTITKQLADTTKLNAVQIEAIQRFINQKLDELASQDDLTVAKVLEKQVMITNFLETMT